MSENKDINHKISTNLTDSSQKMEKLVKGYWLREKTVINVNLRR